MRLICVLFRRPHVLLSNLILMNCDEKNLFFIILLLNC